MSSPVGSSSALGVVTGVDTAADINLLEDSQRDSDGGIRKPRTRTSSSRKANVRQLRALHNPGGYATSSVARARPLLNFWPSKTGGIFQFPMDRLSPRTSRGTEGRAVPLRHAVAL